MTLPRYEPIQLDSNELTELMAVAFEAADAAATVTNRYFRHSFSVENKASQDQFDPVTIADREAELAIRHVLRTRCPEIGFYGEEHDTISSKNGLIWVVDPIDGTRAFMSGMPLWGTLIALYNGRDAVLGLMDQPFLNERYSAFAETAKLTTPTSECTLVTRFVPDVKKATAYCTTPDMFSDSKAKACFQALKSTVQLMRYGGDCYAYALLAAGYLDIVIDCDLKPYDIQALIPIVSAAGGVVSTWSGDSAVDGNYVVACGSNELHSKVLSLLAM